MVPRSSLLWGSTVYTKFFRLFSSNDPVPYFLGHTKHVYSAVYTGIKKPELFSHSGFSLKVARQLPLNTPKNPNRKTHLHSVIFWNSAEISLVFCQCKRSLQSRRFQRNHPTAARDVMRTTRVRSKVERSSACAPLTKTQVWDSGFFRACASRAKNPECYGFFWQCKRYNKKPRFFGFWFFANVNGPYAATVDWK